MPRVSIITPFYNTARYLPECIEGVLGQTFRDFEYLLVDNASTDDSREIAESYARRDARVRVIHFDAFLPQVPNYNRALRQGDPAADYCKMAQADDILLPRCLEEMVARADSDDAIGLVGAYTILQNRVFLDGLDYYETVIDGNDFVRRYLLDGRYILGNPTSHLYRMRDVLAAESFYSESSVIEDAEAAIRLVLGRKFGFVHQTLSLSRRDNQGVSSAISDYNISVLTRRVLLEKFGRQVMDEGSFQRQRRILRNRHNRVLGRGWLTRIDPAFWDLHRRGLRDCGLEISRVAVAGGACVVALRSAFNLEQSLRALSGAATGARNRR